MRALGMMKHADGVEQNTIVTSTERKALSREEVRDPGEMWCVNVLLMYVLMTVIAGDAAD